MLQVKWIPEPPAIQRGKGRRYHRAWYEFPARMTRGGAAADGPARDDLRQPGPRACSPVAGVENE